MGVTGFMKRILPFFGAFAVGIFIASFFVTVSGPRFRGHGRGHEMRRLRMENEELRNENLRLRNDLENRDWSSHHAIPGLDEGLNVEVPVPLPPPPPLPSGPSCKHNR